MINYLDQRTELDLKNPVSLFVIFFVLLCVSAWLVSQFNFDTKLFGTQLIKHLSDIMIEHEAGKSMFVLSIFALIISYLKYLVSLRYIISPPINRYLVLAPINFLVSLVFVEMAVTYSVIISVPKGPISYWADLFYLGGKNTFLAVTLLTSLAILNISDGFQMGRLKQLVITMVLSSAYFWALTW